jgi:hypothetical protein
VRFCSGSTWQHIDEGCIRSKNDSAFYNFVGLRVLGFSGYIPKQNDVFEKKKRSPQ